MKILLFSDVHANRNHCQRLCQLSGKADLVIGAGDFGALRKGTRKTISWLCAITKPSILVPGNAESYEELQQSCTQWPSARVLHGSQTEINGIVYFGIGGGIPVTPFGSWSYDFTEEEAGKLLSDCPKRAVLISHSPPLGLLDVSSRGIHLGSTTVRNFIEQMAPILVVCGHIHESSGQVMKFNQTDIVNAGPEGLIYELKLPA